MKKIVITGARGFIGRYLTRRLASKGYDVLGLGRIPQSDKLGMVDLSNNSIRDDGLTLREYLCKAQVVIHLAAKQVDDPKAPVSDYFSSHLVATEQICRALDVEHAEKVIFASSRLVYSGSIQGDISESAPCFPDTTYGLCKKFAEDLLNYYAAKGSWNSISLRLGQVYGPDPRMRGAISRFMKQAMETGRITVFGQGMAIRDFIYLEDVLDAFEKAVEVNAPTGAYNIGSCSGFSILDLAKAVKDQFTDPPAVIIHQHVENEDQSRYVMNCRQAGTYLGWRPNWSLAQAIHELYSFFQKQHDRHQNIAG